MSTTFTDKTGHVWDAALTAATVGDVLEATGLDLSKATANDFAALKKIASDIAILVNVTAIIVKPQMTPVEFWDRVKAGPVIEQMGEALLNAITEFQPRRARHLINKALEKTKDLHHMEA